MGTSADVFAHLVNLDSTTVFGFIDGPGPERQDLGVWIFERPSGFLEARCLPELEEVCAAIDEADQSSHILFVADYEVGSWFEPKLNFPTQNHTWAPVQAWVFQTGTWIGREEFDEQLDQILEKTGADRQPSGIARIRAEFTEAEYAAAVKSALDHIASGDVYQINLTWGIDFTFFGSPLVLYRQLRRAQPVNYGACLRFPDRTILSLSPELFLGRSGNKLVAKPMKGTMARAADKDTDQKLAAALESSPKDRAENLMIVDLIRNDLGKIAQHGSVHVNQLFGIERYPTVFQMVSQISATVPDRALLKTLKALFPSGSVTGAPKIRAMEIINALERSSRGIYTGTIGHIKPGGDFVFNVAIRTIELLPGNRGRLHVGSGIVADSSAEAEYRECWSKARFITDLPCRFALLETLLLKEGEVKRIDAHLRRLKASARFFDFKYSESCIRQRLLSLQQTWPIGKHRVRLTLEKNGDLNLEIQPLVDLPDRLSFAIASERVESNDPLLRHKTTARRLYDDVLSRIKQDPACFDALFFNERGELAEGARSNVFLVKQGVWLTPPLESGVLNGTMRQEILQTRQVQVCKLFRKDLENAEAVYLSNALRGLIRVSQ